MRYVSSGASMTYRFVDEMPNARLKWVEECGHVPHLEQPSETAQTIMDFVKNGNPVKVWRIQRTYLGRTKLTSRLNGIFGL